MVHRFASSLVRRDGWSLIRCASLIDHPFVNSSIHWFAGTLLTDSLNFIISLIRWPGVIYRFTSLLDHSFVNSSIHWCAGTLLADSLRFVGSLIHWSGGALVTPLIFYFR